MSLQKIDNEYTFTNHKEVANGINKESAELYESIRLHYKKYYSWLNSRGVDYCPLVISSFGVRRLASDRKGGAHYEGLAIDIARPNLTTTPLKYIALFGFYLQKYLQDAHVSISMHNKHIHVDILNSRRNQDSAEYKTISNGETHYSFTAINDSIVNQIMIDYQFDDKFKGLYDELKQYGSSKEAGLGMFGLILLLILLGLMSGDRK